MYFSPVSKKDDVINIEKYFSQKYWMNELIKGEELAFSHVPQPHCYRLLGLQAFVDLYRATGKEDYFNAAISGWNIYRDNYKHVGGITAICENNGTYPPKSYYLTRGCNGETCGGVFWIDLNKSLQQLYPNEEKYASEIEESIYNVILASQDTKGYTRYHNRLHWKKQEAECVNTCCEVSAVDMISRLPELIFSITKDGLYVNQYISSSISWENSGGNINLVLNTAFPFGAKVAARLEMEKPKEMNIRFRVPSWASKEMCIMLNGKYQATGKPGSYVSIERLWNDNDVVSFTLPVQPNFIKYQGLEQLGQCDRYAIMYGPILMTMICNMDHTNNDAPVLNCDPQNYSTWLKRKNDKELKFIIENYPEYYFTPYWDVQEETFTCYPIFKSKVR